MQIAAGHPEPRIQLFPRMCQVIRGVELTRSVRGNQMRTRLPITLSILQKLRGSWWSQGSQSSALTAFFGFCQLGELTVPREGDYDPYHSQMWPATTNSVRQQCLSYFIE